MHHIVFIHPDHKLHSLYKRHLANYFRVDSAYDGLEGLRLIKKSQPALIVSEYHLPSISGATLLKFVRSHKTLEHVPFVFLSQMQPTIESLNLGSNDWVVAGESTPDRLIEICHIHLKLSPKFVSATDFGAAGRPLYV